MLGLFGEFSENCLMDKNHVELKSNASSVHKIKGEFPNN